MTVGSQMPFDRLTRALDGWAALHPAQAVLAQIGQTDFKPHHMAFCQTLPPAEFRQRVAEAELVVAHAGMGAVLTALEFSKPLLLLARRGDLRETRNDHQVATARWLAGKPGITVAQDAADLAALLTQSLQAAGLQRPQQAPPAEALIGFLRHYLGNSAGRP